MIASHPDHLIRVSVLVMLLLVRQAYPCFSFRVMRPCCSVAGSGLPIPRQLSIRSSRCPSRSRKLEHRSRQRGGFSLPILPKAKGLG